MDILGFGACAVDDLLYVDEFPARDGKTRVQERRREGGGLAATALVAAARLGANVAWCGVLGSDEASRFSLDELKRESVDVSRVQFQAEARPHYSVIIVERSSGSRSILACNEGVMPFPVEQVNEDLIRGCKVLFVDHTVVETAICAANLARSFSIPVVADIERIVDGLDELLPLVGHLIVGVDAARLLSGESDAENAARILSAGREIAVVTDGASGCWFCENGKTVRHQAAFKVDVVDTTGCGDVFHGAYLACLARGENLEDSVRFASAVAAIKATKQGGRSGIPNRVQVEEFLEKYA